MKKAESVFLEKWFDCRTGRGVLHNKYVPAYPFRLNRSFPPHGSIKYAVMLLEKAARHPSPTLGGTAD
jgi:hypothetical protein